MPESDPRQPSRRPSSVSESGQPKPAESSRGMWILFFVLSTLMVGGMWWYFSRPTRPQPATPPTTSGRTPAQNLAILSGRPVDDPDTAAALARLDALCPENEGKLADVLVNLQTVLEKAGKRYELPYLMQQLTTAQEGSGLTCLETATGLSLMLEK